jgi:hypothetical protein
MLTLREWQKIKVPSELLIVQASTIDGCDAQTASPIGMSYQYVDQKGNEIACQIGNHEKTVLCALNGNTDFRRRENKEINRKKIIERLETNGIRNTLLDADNYFVSLPQYKFVISPEGNGIDTHRHYEALMAGCIPVIEENHIIRAKYGNAPILWTRDYSEITEDYLQQQYTEMLDKTWDFSRLIINNWSVCEQYIIRQRGNYWCEKLTGSIWYK